MFDGYLHVLLFLSNRFQHLEYLPRRITIIRSVYRYLPLRKPKKGESGTERVQALAATLRLRFVQFILPPRPFFRGFSRYMCTSFSRPMSFLLIPRACHRCASTAIAKAPNSTIPSVFTSQHRRNLVVSATHQSANRHKPYP